MSIIHIERPIELERSSFEVFTPPAVGNHPQPTLGSVGAYAEFCHFVRGRATFVAEDGHRYEFKAGDAAYFPPRTRGTWTVHETLRKTYCVWR